MADAKMFNFRFDPKVREWMARLAEQRGITMTAAMHEAAMEWIVREELRRP